MPVKLKVEVVDQIDLMLARADSDGLAGIILLPKTVDGHIATPIILDFLYQLEDIATHWDLITNFEKSDPPLCLNENGDCFLLLKRKGCLYQLQERYRGGDEGDIRSFWVTEDEMFNVMGILPQALSITKKQPQSALSQPLLPPPSKSADEDSAAVQEHYVIKHFRRQSRTALSIIGISVVIALLGVITPLGFQTFTD